MKDNSINWVGNRVMDPNVQRQPSSKGAPMERPQTIVTPTSPMTTQQPQTRSQTQPPCTQIPPMTSQMQHSDTQTPPTRTSDGQMPLFDREGPPPIMDILYVPGYLTSLIGKGVRAEFVVGTNMFLDKTGILREVGVNYFVLEDFITRARIMCDLYSVKFVTTL